MTRTRRSRQTWTTSHDLENDEFEFEGLTYAIKSSVTISWLDDSDYDREYGYGDSISAEEVEIDSLEVVLLIHADGEDTELAITDEKSPVWEAAEEWVREQASEQDHRE